MGSFSYKLERMVAKIAIPGLIYYIIGFNLLVFILGAMNPEFIQTLFLKRELVLKGEIWRLITFAFVPPTDSIIFIIFQILLLLRFGTALEAEWGTTRFNIFFFSGMLGTIIGVMIFGGIDITGIYLQLSIFFAFATLNPTYQILVFFVLPVQVRWLALIAAAGVALTFLAVSFPQKIAILVAFVNYLAFFGPQALKNIKERRKISARRTEFKAKSIPDQEPLHRCDNCGRTDESHPDLEFRVTADDKELCVECLALRRQEEQLATEEK